MTATALNEDSDSPRFALRAPIDRITGLEPSSYADVGFTSNHVSGGVGYVVRRRETPASTPRQKVAEMIGAEPQKIVRVDIREVEQDIAKGEILGFGGQDVSVSLPLALFPEDQAPRVGRSYDLEMVVDGGIKRPKLTLRPGNAAAYRQQKDELWNLARRFGG